MHRLSVILIISMIFVLAAPCTALAGGKVEQTYKPKKEDGTTSATKRISNPSTGSAIKRVARDAKGGPLGPHEASWARTPRTWRLHVGEG